MDLNKAFIAYHKKENTFDQIHRVLVAFSGGKDSVCLLRLLWENKEELGLSVGACHVHHGIRGDEAERDLLFCQNLCREIGIPFYFARVDTPAFCKENKVGLEEGGRHLRYRALEEIRKTEGFDAVATAHTASDQAETILFRLTRGTGFAGAGGIEEKREYLLRPLLSFSTEQVMAYLEENTLPFTLDSTNTDTLFSRNRIRANVLPELKKINPNAESALVRFGKMAHLQNLLCLDLCRELEEKMGEKLSSGTFPLSPLTEMAKNPAKLPVLYTALSKMTEREKISIDFQHFANVLSLLNDPCEGKIIEISRSFIFCIHSGKLMFVKNERETAHIKYHVAIQEGENKIAPIGQSVTLSEKRRGKVSNFNKKHLIIHLASDRIEGSLFARNWEMGDRIRMDEKTRSVKKMFCDAHVPRSVRHRIPVICDEKEIVWIPYFGLCDKVRHSPKEEIVTLTLSGEDTQKF